MKLYNIVYEKNKIRDNISCTEYSKEVFERTIIRDGGNVLKVKLLNAENTKENSLEKQKMQKYYNLEYIRIQRKHKQEIINKIDFQLKIAQLKKLKRECKTKEEFEKMTKQEIGF